MTKEKLESLKRITYVDEEVLKSFPKGGNIKDITFFTVGKTITCEELQKEYENRGLIPCTIDVLFEYDKKHGDDLDSKNNVATQCKDNKGNWCYAAFGLWYDERHVYVNRHDDDWDDCWWFAGLASSSKSLDTKSSEYDKNKIYNPLDWEIISNDGVTVSDETVSKVKLSCESGAGDEVAKKIGKIALNSNSLKYFLDNPSRIPNDWKNKYVFFDGTSFLSPSGLRYTLYLCWDGYAWRWNYHWLGNDRSLSNPSAVLEQVSSDSSNSQNSSGTLPSTELLLLKERVKILEEKMSKLKTALS